MTCNFDFKIVSRFAVKVLMLALLACAQMVGQGVRVLPQLTVTTPGGGVVPSPTFRVCIEPASGTNCTPTASLFLDRGMTQAATNPIPGDQFGNIPVFYVAPGIYHLQINGPGIQQIDISYVSVADLTLPVWQVANAATCSTTVSLDPTVATIFPITLTGNCTASLINVTAGVNLFAGKKITLKVTQDVVGGRTFTCPAGFLNCPVVTSIGANNTVTTDFFFDGVNWNPSIASNNSPISFLAPDGSAAAPGYAFGLDPTTGWYRQLNNSILTGSTQGVGRIQIYSAGVLLNSTVPLSWVTGGVGSGADTSLSRISSATVAVGNGTQGDASGTLKGQSVLLTQTSTNFTNIFLQPLANGTPRILFGTGGTHTNWELAPQNSFSDELEIDNGTGNTDPTASTYTAIFRLSGGGRMMVPGTSGAYTFSASASSVLTSPDTGLSRVAVGTAAIGNGTVGDQTGTLKLHSLQFDVNSSSLIGTVGAAPSIVAYDIGLQRSAGGSSFPDVFGDGTHALVIGGKSDGSGVVALGATTQLQAPDGSATVPSYSFGSHSNTGIYQTSTANTLGFTSNGTTGFLLGLNVARFGNAYTVSWSSNVDPTVAGSDTGLSRISANVIGVGNGTQGDFSGTVKASGFQGITPTSQVFTSSGTFTIPTGITAVKVTVVAGGGGGGGATTNGVSGCAGGSSSGSGIKWLSGLTPGNTLTVTVGGGGAGNSAASGSNGVASSVSSGTQTITTITANPGLGSGCGTSGAVAGAAAGSGGDLNLTGNSAPLWQSGISGQTGAASIFGGAGLGAGTATNGNSASGFGSGGGGSGNPQGAGGPFTGGSGSGGVVIFEWAK